MTGQHRAAQFVKSLAASFAFVPLTRLPLLVPTSFDDLLRIAMRALHSLRPPQLPDRFITLVVIDQTLDAYFHTRRNLVFFPIPSIPFPSLISRPRNEERA